VSFDLYRLYLILDIPHAIGPAKSDRQDEHHLLNLVWVCDVSVLFKMLNQNSFLAHQYSNREVFGKAIPETPLLLLSLASCIPDEYLYPSIAKANLAWRTIFVASDAFQNLRSCWKQSKYRSWGTVIGNVCLHSARFAVMGMLIKNTFNR
jgi:hypothetical protein